MLPSLEDHAKLLRGDHVAQFGDGYRQIAGPTLVEGSLEEVFRAFAALPEDTKRQAYLFVGSDMKALNRSEIEDLADRMIHDV